MLSEKLKPLTHIMQMVILLCLLAAGCGHAALPTCTTRRCLAQSLVNKKYLTQPQNDNCTLPIFVPFIEYQTLSVDTKNLRLLSRMELSIMWDDADLAWNKSVYPYDEVILPVEKIWSPGIRVTNAIVTTMKHSSLDVLVSCNGSVKHKVIINAEINCEVNMFNYPFAADECPVAIQAWSNDGCGTELILGDLMVVDGSHGDWRTDSAVFQKQRDDRNYIMVDLSIRYSNPFITLLVPSILIVLADMVSFSLPLGGGERNSFKVTLVLSFTMFLIILNDQLPGDSHCSPIIRIHFCICLVLLVLSMLVSMVLTRVAKEGPLVLCCWSKRPENLKDKEKEKEDEEAKADVSAVKLDAPDENNQMLRKVVGFLESIDAKEAESERYHNYADKIDKAFFWLYFILGILYFIAMTTVMITYTCTVNHFDFWY